MGYGMGAGERLVKLTKVDGPIPSGTPRALLVGTAGTCNLVDGSGNPCTAVPLQAGYNPIVITQFKTGGTVNDVWGIY